MPPIKLTDPPKAVEPRSDVESAARSNEKAPGLISHLTDNHLMLLLLLIFTAYYNTCFCSRDYHCCC